MVTPSADSTQPSGTTSDPGSSRTKADAQGPTLNVTVAATVEHIASLRRTARAFAEHHHVARPTDVALAVSEACANVVVHAYCDRAPGALHLTGFVDELIYLSVADEGSGLTPRLDSPGLGLGLPLIARTTDHFEITERAPSGTLLTMGFTAEPPPPPAPVPAGQEAVDEQLRRSIAAAVEEDADLKAVEKLLDRASLSAETRDALWLYAWSTLELHQRRHPATTWRPR